MTAEGLLKPYRVLELADYKGVFCGKILADLGADVIKVEPPEGDRGRYRSPFFHDEIHPEKSLYFLYYNTNKRSVTLNLEHHDGQVIFKELVKRADAIIETFPVGYLRSFGLGYEMLKEVNQGLVMASITPFGQTGPYKDYKSSDLISMGMSGYMQVTGETGGPPLRLGDEQSHFAPSQFAATSIVAALYYRNISGIGQHIDVSMQEAIFIYNQDAHAVTLWHLLKQNVTRSGLRLTNAVPTGGYPCKDGWCAICIATEPDWDTLAQWIHEVTGEEEVLNPRFRGGLHTRGGPDSDLVNAFVVEFTSKFSKREIVEEGQRRGLAVLPLNIVADVLDDPHLKFRGFWVNAEHALVGTLKYPGGCLHSDDIPVAIRPAPLVGEHNEEVYCGELGFTKEQLVTLRGGGVI